MNNRWHPSLIIGDKPKYISLVETIEADFQSGKLQAGDRLPSNRELAEIFGITVATVTKAMAEASRRGIIDARVGSGTFIREQTNTSAQVTISNQLDLALNTLPTSLVSDILQNALALISPEQRSEHMFSYSSYINSERNRRLGATWLANCGTDVSPDRILLTTGVHQGLLAAFRTLLPVGENALCESLTYTGIRRIAEFRGINLIGVNCDQYGLLPDSLGFEIERSKPKALIVTSSLHNPTTTTLPLERRHAIVDLCRRSDVKIIEDAVNVPVANDGLPSLYALAPERTIFLTGFSKCIASGFRLGYAAMPEEFLDLYNEALIGSQWIGPTFFAELAAVMSDAGMIEECVNRHREEAALRTALAHAILPGVVKSTPAYYVWVNPSAYWDPDTFAAHALRAGIRVSPASHFAVSSASSSDGFRVSLGTVQSRLELKTGLLKLAALSRDNHTHLDTVI